MLKFILTVTSLFLWTSTASATAGCTPTENYEVHDFSGEVYGRARFELKMGIRTLVLDPVEGGWRLRIFNVAGLEIPLGERLHGASRPNDVALLAGADFLQDIDTRYRDQGRVLRQFMFEPGGGSANIHPGHAGPIAAVEPSEGENGVGEFFIEDYGLADRFDGREPRVTYLKFSGCLGWDQGYRGQDWRMGSDPGTPDAAITAMRHCGFPNHDYKLTDRALGWGERGSAAYYELDMTGDGVLDFVAPARRLSDGAEGLAICMRAGNRLKLAGFDAGDIADFIEHGEYWSLNRAPVKPGGLRPMPAGESLVIGLDRGLSILVYLDADGNVQVHRQGG